jgi:hypothetical protein
MNAKEEYPSTSLRYNHGGALSHPWDPRYMGVSHISIPCWLHGH